MGRATKKTLEALAPFLDDVRAIGIEGLVEKANGAFYVRRTPVLHFHEDHQGIHADLKIDGDWQSVQLDRGHGKRTVLALLRRHYRP